jgi:hypothetical protein
VFDWKGAHIPGGDWASLKEGLQNVRLATEICQGRFKTTSLLLIGNAQHLSSESGGLIPSGHRLCGPFQSFDPLLPR